MRVCPKCYESYDGKLNNIKRCIKCGTVIENIIDEDMIKTIHKKQEDKACSYISKAKSEGRTITCKKCGKENVIASEKKEMLPSTARSTNCESCGEYLLGNPMINLILGSIETVFVLLVIIRSFSWWLLKINDSPVFGVGAVIVFILFIDGLSRTIRAYQNIKK